MRQRGKRTALARARPVDYFAVEMMQDFQEWQPVPKAGRMGEIARVELAAAESFLDLSARERSARGFFLKEDDVAKGHGNVRVAHG